MLEMFKCLGILFHIMFQKNSSKQLDPPSNIFALSKMHAKLFKHRNLAKIAFFCDSEVPVLPSEQLQ